MSSLNNCRSKVAEGDCAIFTLELVFALIGEIISLRVAFNREALFSAL